MFQKWSVANVFKLNFDVIIFAIFFVRQRFGHFFQKMGSFLKSSGHLVHGENKTPT
jgi:hypothetical protein